MIAETMIGRGDQAFDYYKRINPSAREDISEIHRCEPYVYAQMISGKEARKPGEAKNSWLTGTAAWNYVAITQWILGIRPTFDGLRISPVIPERMERFRSNPQFPGSSNTLSKSKGTERGIWSASKLMEKQFPEPSFPFHPKVVLEVRVTVRVS